MSILIYCIVISRIIAQSNPFEKKVMIYIRVLLLIFILLFDFHKEQKCVKTFRKITPKETTIFQ